MGEQAEQEHPNENLLRIVYVARSIEELNRVLLILHEHGVSAYALPDHNSFIPLPYMIRPYRVRIGVPTEEAKEALIIIKALELKAGYTVKGAVGDLKRALFWSFQLALASFAVSFIYHRDPADVNYAAVLLIWVAGFFLISQILGFQRRRSERSDDNPDEPSERGE
jgi:hypothetical protein